MTASEAGTNALRQRGDKYLAGPEDPSMVVSHRGCGAPGHVKLVCEQGHEVGPEDLERRPGPGVRPRTAA